MKSSALLLLALLLVTDAPSQLLGAVEPISIFQPGTRIVFQGDSITDGNRGRSEDPNHILGHGYVFIIAAQYGAAFPGLNLTFINRGTSGNKVTDLEKRWQQDTIDLKPDILSILIGVNDNGNVSLEQYEQVYDNILTEAEAANPKIRLVLCEPFCLPVGKVKEKWDSFSKGIRAEQGIVARLAQKHHAALVKFQQAFDTACKRAPADHWIWDGIHPTYSGHQIMAEEWVRTVREYWPRG
jgi:lysophospholipase L1-like esterase